MEFENAIFDKILKTKLFLKYPFNPGNFAEKGVLKL